MSYKAKQTPLNYCCQKTGVVSDHDINLVFEPLAPVPQDLRQNVYISNNPHGFTWDLSQTIGNRPIWKGYFVGDFNPANSPTRVDKQDYGCYQPYWCPRCN